MVFVRSLQGGPLQKSLQSHGKRGIAESLQVAAWSLQGHCQDVCTVIAESLHGCCEYGEEFIVGSLQVGVAGSVQG